MTAVRFIADRSLEGVARRLRALGFDVAVLDGRLEQVCADARAEQRVVLTTSRRVPPPCGLRERWVVPRDDLAAAVRAVLARCEPDAAPFTRCVHCNEPLVAFDGSAGPPPVAPPAGVRVTGQCPRCGRCYWHGSHVDRTREWIERETGRHIVPPSVAPEAPS